MSSTPSKLLQAGLSALPAGRTYLAGRPVHPSGAGAVRPAPRRAFRHQRLVPGGLILLSAIPVLAGAVRLTELAGGADITPGSARFFASPVPVVLHIASATLYSLVGAFQFAPALRRARGGRHNWHRAAGRFLIPAGVVAALTGLWMAVFYDLPASDGPLLLILRLAAGTGMLASIILAILALRKRDFVRHGAWMTRAYAIAAGAGTQALILIVPELLSGPPDVTGRAVLMGAGWALNLAVAEYAIRRRAGASAPATGRRQAGPANRVTRNRSIEPATAQKEDAMADAPDRAGIRRKKRLVAVIGAGYAGVMAANRVRSSLTPEEAEQTGLVIINPTDSFIERIRLHEVAAGTIPTAAIALSTVLHPDIRLLEGAAVLIDPRDQTVAVSTSTRELTLRYDLLVYAVGSLASSTVPGTGTYAYALADAGGALAARTAIQQGPPGQHILIVGGGYTAIEAASEIAGQHPGAAVTLLCGGEPAGSMTLHARRSIRKSLDRLNINVRTGARVTAVTAQGAVLESGERVAGDVCIWAASFAVPRLAALSGLATDPAGRLRVDSCLRSTDYPDIIGAGDAVVLPPGVGGHLRMGCAAALPMGSFAARTVLARLRGAEPEPVSIGYLLQCLSLGRRDSYIQIVGPDDSPRRFRVRGRTGAWIKEAICRMTLRALRNERIRPGSYKAPKGPRVDPPVDVSAPPGAGR